MTTQQPDQPPMSRPRYHCDALGHPLTLSRHCQERFVERLGAERWSECRSIVKALIRQAQPVLCWSDKGNRLRYCHGEFPAVGIDGWVLPRVGKYGDICPTALCASKIIHQD